MQQLQRSSPKGQKLLNFVREHRVSLHTTFNVQQLLRRGPKWSKLLAYIDDGVRESWQARDYSESTGNLRLLPSRESSRTSKRADARRPGLPVNGKHGLRSFRT